MSCLSGFGSLARQSRRGLENEMTATGRSFHCGEMIVKTAGCGGGGGGGRELLRRAGIGPGPECPTRLNNEIR